MRTVLKLVTAVALGVGLAAVPASPAMAADPVGKIQQMGAAPYALFLVKDLGGGAYWNVTTSSMFVLSTGSAALISTAQTGAELTAQLAANGRDLLLLVNGAVLVPLGDALR
jgi:hypothetical protein